MKTLNKLSLIFYALFVLLLCFAGLLGLTSGALASVIVVTETTQSLHSSIWSLVLVITSFVAI